MTYALLYDLLLGLLADSPLDSVSGQPEDIDVGRHARCLLRLQLLPAVDDRGAEFHRVARDENEALALGEVEAGKRASGTVAVAAPKTGASDAEPFEHGADVPHDVVVSLPGALCDLQARHRQARGRDGGHQVHG